MGQPAVFPLDGRRIFVAGHRGMVGSALIRRLAQEECRVLTVGRDAVDLRDQASVDRWFDEHRPEAVLVAAARVGGIHENATHPGDFLYDNLAIATNVIEASRRMGVAKLLFLGSSCIYPRLAPQPMPESCLLTGPLAARELDIVLDHHLDPFCEVDPRPPAEGVARLGGIAA